MMELVVIITTVILLITDYLLCASPRHSAKNFTCVVSFNSHDNLLSLLLLLCVFLNNGKKTNKLGCKRLSNLPTIILIIQVKTRFQIQSGF